MLFTKTFFPVFKHIYFLDLVQVFKKQSFTETAELTFPV